MGCDTQLVGVSATGGGQLPGAPDEVVPDDELLLDDELLDDELLDDELLDDELLDDELLDDELLDDELLASPPLEDLLGDESPSEDVPPPQATSNDSVLAAINAGAYLRPTTTAGMCDRESIRSVMVEN